MYQATSLRQELNYPTPQRSRLGVQPTNVAVAKGCCIHGLRRAVPNQVAFYLRGQGRHGTSASAPFYQVDPARHDFPQGGQRITGPLSMAGVILADQDREHHAKMKREPLWKSLFSECGLGLYNDSYPDVRWGAGLSALTTSATLAVFRLCKDS